MIKDFSQDLHATRVKDANDFKFFEAELLYIWWNISCDILYASGPF